jgi:hypothetical protein
MRSSGSRCEKLVELLKEHIQWMRMTGRQGKATDIKNSGKELESDGRGFKTRLNVQF